MQIRVGLVCDHLDIGGQETGILELAGRLDRARFRPSLYAFRGGRLVPAVQALGIPVLVGSATAPFGSTWTREDDREYREHVARLSRALREDGIDVALVYSFERGVVAARAAGVRAIVERVDGPGLATRIRDKSSCRRVICESRSLRDLLLGQRALLRLKPRRLVVVPNGVDLRRLDPDRPGRAAARAALGVGPDVFAVGTVARVAPEKNLGQLLAAAHLFAEAHPADAAQRQILIAGPDRGERARLEAEAARLGIGERIRFLGPRTDVPAVLGALDVYVLTSLFEGVPFSLLEAMAMGLPVVTTPIPAVGEVIAGNGFVVGTGDAYQTYLALRDLFARPALRARLGRRSRALARGHDVDEMVRRYEQVIEDALADARSGPRLSRRVLLVEEHASSPADELFRRLRAADVDAYLVRSHLDGAPRRASGEGMELGWPHWPPGRRYRVPARAAADATVALGETLAWIDPDLVLAASAEAARRLRERLPTAEVLEWSDGERLLGAALGSTALRS